MEKANSKEFTSASVARGAGNIEKADAQGFYEIECRDKNGNLKWKDFVKNLVTTEGKNTALTHYLKGSTYTAVNYMGLISSVSYTTGPAAGDTLSSHGGWTEAVAGTCANRGTPSFGTASGGSLALSSGLAFSIIGTDTIKGVFLAIKSSAGTSPTSTPGNTNGALYSAGLFSGGDKSVGNGDTLTVTYTASL